MAGARPKSFTPSVYKGSEDVVECPCTPCERGGHTIEAIHFCTDCLEYFCSVCTDQHTKFGITASHNVVDKSRAKQTSRGKTSKGQLPTERCQEHHGELITSFCKDHDVVVCNSCATMDHRSCDNMAYIPTVASESDPRIDVPRIKADIVASLKATKTAKINVQTYKHLTDDEKAKTDTSIKANTKRLISHAQQMEKTALADNARSHHEATVKITAEMAQLDDTEAALERRKNNLDKADTASDSQVFVDIKIGTREAETARKLEQRLMSTEIKNVHAKFVVDDRVESFLSDVRFLGKVSKNEPYKAVLETTYDVKKLLKGDLLSCDICDSCEIQSGEYLMTDFTNNFIKKVDTSYKVVKRFRMPSTPWGICQTSPNKVAVTLMGDRKVQFVDITGSWKLTGYFKVEERCRGIAYSKDELFVSCGGFPGSEFEGPGFVAILDMTGSLRRKIIGSNGLRIFSCPRTIAFSNNGNMVHIADQIRGVITVDRQGNLLSIFNENLKYALGICTINTDKLIVCGKDSNNVLLISSGGKMITELLSKKDGLKRPCCLLYSRINSTMSVFSFESNEIKVFKLHS